MTILDRLRLEGRVAMVTGMDRTLGRAAALALAQAGADVIAVGPAQDEAETAAAALRDHGRRVLAAAADLTLADDLDWLVQRGLDTFGRIDILVNGAGGAMAPRDLSLADISDAAWRSGIDADLTTTFTVCRAVLPHMVERQQGKILNIASGLGIRGARGNYAFTAAKAAVINLTRSLALSYWADNIHVNGIAPGAFRAPTDPPSGRDGVYVPVGRAGQPWEIGPVVVFLCSPAADGITGETVVQDGGGLAAGIAPTGWAPEIMLPAGTV